MPFVRRSLKMFLVLLMMNVDGLHDQSDACNCARDIVGVAMTVAQECVESKAQPAILVALSWKTYSILLSGWSDCDKLRRRNMDSVQQQLQVEMQVEMLMSLNADTELRFDDGVLRKNSNVLSFSSSVLRSAIEAHLARDANSSTSASTSNHCWS
jgi:vacuolar-type H+-ATPase catalytic subunit A/Vma1